MEGGGDMWRSYGEDSMSVERRGRMRRGEGGRRKMEWNQPSPSLQSPHPPPRPHWEDFKPHIARAHYFKVEAKGRTKKERGTNPAGRPLCRALSAPHM